MDYTLSNGYATDAGTGQRMHLQAQAIPTVVTDIDMNSVLWSGMEVIKQAGLAGAQFDKATVSTYQKLRDAIAIMVRQQSAAICTAGGTADALTGVYTPVVSALINGIVLYVRSTLVNATATPTFQANATVAKTIVKGNGLPLVAGDIAGGGHWIELQYDSALDKWVLLNPAVPIGVGAISYRNKILNGAFRTNRRGYVSGTALAAGVPATSVGYGHDGWRAGAGGGTYTFAQMKSATQITITAGTMITAMEDADIDQTLMILSWTGTAMARIGVNGAAPSGSYAASPILIACTAGQQVSAEFGVGTLGTVQAENGAARTPMEWVSQQQQDTRCQRYLPSMVSANGTNSPVCYAYANSATQATAIWNFPVKARVAPTGLLGRSSADFTVNYSVGVSACTGFAFSAASYDGMQINCTVASSLTANSGCNIFMNNAAGYLFATGAEL